MGTARQFEYQVSIQKLPVYFSRCFSFFPKGSYDYHMDGWVNCDSSKWRRRTQLHRVCSLFLEIGQALARIRPESPAGMPGRQ